MQYYETPEQLYEDIDQVYERVAEDCFNGLHKLFAASYPNYDRSDLKEIFAVIAWELCKAKAEIEKLKLLRDPDRIPLQFIQPLIEFYGIKNFPTTVYPEDQRRFLSYAYEIQKYSGTRYGLQLLLKSLMPNDEITIMPMYKRGLRRYYPNNDYTGGRRAGSIDPTYVTQLNAGMPVDWRTQGTSTYPTGVYICVTVNRRRTQKVIRGLLTKIEPILKEFMPENGFYKFVYVNEYLDPYAVTFDDEVVTYEDDPVTFGNDFDDPDTGEQQYLQVLYQGELHNLLVNNNPVYYST